MQVSIVDYKCGNITSLKNILNYLGSTVSIAVLPQDLENADRIILPGVGSFGYGMQKLKESNLLPTLNDLAQIKKLPILGICLGAQLLLESSEESPEANGLGWIKGQIKKLTPKKKLSVPHNGWSHTRYLDNPATDSTKVYYYTHSYYMSPSTKSAVKAVCNYSEDFAAIVQEDNILGCQFHPEKSHIDGMEFLKQFLTC